MVNTAISETTCTTQLLDVSSKLQEQYESTTTPEERKERGQVFTPPLVARFMAHLASTPPANLKVLDAGAGTGTLSAAVCERILLLRSPRTVKIVLFETDPMVVPLLHENLRRCRAALRAAGHRLTFEIRDTDFILANAHAFEQPSLFHATSPSESFDIAIMNPPYFKIQKRSESWGFSN